MSSEMKPIYSVTGTTEVIDRSDGLGFHDQLLNEFHELDRKVREHAASALIFCDALMEICTRKLYEVDGFASWLDYCSSRNISVRHAQRLVNAGKIRREIATCDPGVALPTSEKHLRAISAVPEGDRAKVVLEAQKRAANEGRDPVTRDYAEAARTHQTKATAALPKDSVVVPGKVQPRHADQPEEYLDEEGYPVPEELWPVWRDIPEFMDVADKIRSSGVMEQARRLVQLGVKHKAPSIIKTGNEIERMHNSIVQLALGCKPARVDGDDWVTRAEALES
jgi:hypothetical protein